MSFAYLCFSWIVPSPYIEFELYGDSLFKREPHLVKTRCLPSGDQGGLSRLIGGDFHSRYLSYPKWQKQIASKYVTMQRLPK